jgi:hypothetical protein
MIKEDEMGRACTTHGAMNTCKILVGKPEERETNLDVG